MKFIIFFCILTHRNYQSCYKYNWMTSIESPKSGCILFYSKTTMMYSNVMVHIIHVMLIKNHNLINIHYLLTRLDGFSQNAFEDTGS